MSTFENISPELREKARACASAEELFELARAEGIELTDEQLQAVSGGVHWSCVGYNEECPNYSSSMPM